jgi:hypothetical protein
MILTLILLLSISLVTEAKNLQWENAEQLIQLWNSESIYYQPKNRNALIEWNGLVYDHNTKKCFQVEQGQSSQKIKSNELACEKSFLKRATEPYLKIGDFQKFKSRFIGCLNTNDKICLRQLISKTIQLSFGMDGFLDRRDLIFDSWKREDYIRLKKLLSKGTTGDELSKSFPPNPDNDGMGYRGEFKKVNGGWVLVSYLAGD